MSSVVIRAPMIALVAVATSSGSNGPPLVRIKLLTSCTASPAIETLSITVFDVIIAANRGQRPVTSDLITAGDEVDTIASHSSSTRAVAIGSRLSV